MNKNALFAETGNKVSMADLDNPNLAPTVVETAPQITETGQSATPPLEVKKEAPAEVKKEEAITPESVTPKEVTFDTVKEFFEKKYGQKVETEDSLKGIFDSASKVTGYEEAQKNLSELKEKYEILLSQTDPKSLFSSDEAYKLEQFKKQFPDKDVLVANQIFSVKRS